MDLASNKEEPRPDAAVTFADMEDAIAIAIEMMEKRQKAQSDSLMTALGSMIDSKLGPIIDKVNEHTTTLADKPQQQAADPQQRRQSIGELVNDVKPVLDLLRENGWISRPDHAELDGPSKLLNTAIQRRARKIVLQSLDKDMKDGYLFKEEVAAVVGDQIDEHPPI